MARLGRRGQALIFFGGLDVIYSFSLLNPDKASRTGPFLTAVAAIAPLWVWAALWGVVGLVCLFYSFRRHDQIGWTAAIFLKVTWAVTCLTAWLLYGADRGYVSAAIWLFAAWLVWVISGWPEVEGRSAWKRRSSLPSSPESRV